LFKDQKKDFSIQEGARIYHDVSFAGEKMPNFHGSE
jgi:hypothetical protein